MIGARPIGYRQGRMKTSLSSRRVLLLLFALVITVAICYPLPSSGAPSVFRSWFTPTVVPTNLAGPVRFEAEITENPASVVFNYNGVNRAMSDNGNNGDLIAGDGVWTCLFTTAEIFARNLPNRVFRPFIGTCNPTNSGAF